MRITGSAVLFGLVELADGLVEHGLRVEDGLRGGGQGPSSCALSVVTLAVGQPMRVAIAPSCAE